MSDLPNFDTLVKLAQENPEELERLRQEQVSKIINDAPEKTRHRLKGLQFQIDAHRTIHEDSPMGACIKISKMMQESFAELRGWLNHLSDLQDPLRNDAREYEQSDRPADVLVFPAS